MLSKPQGCRVVRPIDGPIGTFDSGRGKQPTIAVECLASRLKQSQCLSHGAGSTTHSILCAVLAVRSDVAKIVDLAGLK